MTIHEIDLLALGETLGNLNGRMTGIEDTVKNLDSRVSDIESQLTSNTTVLDRIDKNTQSSTDTVSVGKMNLSYIGNKILYISIIGIGVSSVTAAIIWALSMFVTGDSK